MAEKRVYNLRSDIAPLEGRKLLAAWTGEPTAGELSWEEGPFSMEGDIFPLEGVRERTVKLLGSINACGGSPPEPGWIEIETAPLGKALINNIFQVGHRPLPEPDITCVCRHPLGKDYLLAATASSRLLVLDARLTANLAAAGQEDLPAPVGALVCFGKRLLGLEKNHGRTLFCLEINSKAHSPGLILAEEVSLPVPLTALAENDAYSAWGLTTDGVVYRLELARLFGADRRKEAAAAGMQRMVRLPGPALRMKEQVKGIYRAIKAGVFPLKHSGRNGGFFKGLAFDGNRFWALFQSILPQKTVLLLMYSRDGVLLNAFATGLASLTSINYLHNMLMVLDTDAGLYCQLVLADTLRPVAAMKPHADQHPGYLPAGTPASGGIHNLCLLYVGGEGKNGVHRYDIDKLKPLVGYISSDGTVEDSFMDGFLFLAQYSPLQNGRSFGTDLEGPPSLQEDWLALFDEYFYPNANLWALEGCVKTVFRQLYGKRPGRVKVVLGIPTPDGRCHDWDGKGYSLQSASHRIETTSWAMQELINRWGKARFRHLVLAGFYYITEQGSWNDPVLQAFPRQCRERGLKSFAIPGIHSSWMTEFTRAGFDCVAFQSSHAFSRSDDRPGCYLLKNAGRIAREFGMGMELELPYDVLETEGRQRVQDYINIAHIQGWAGAFKAYFQSYNLIKSLLDSNIPENRKLYEQIYRLSRVSRDTAYNRTCKQPEHEIPFQAEARWTEDAGQSAVKINFEGHRGVLKIKRLSWD